MAKITIKNQKIFAGGVPASGVVAQFGSLAAAAPAYSNDPDIIQALPAWGEGLKSALIDGYNPTIQDINALLYVITRQIAYRLQSGIPEWNAETTYYIGSLVTDGAGTIYKSVIDDNINNNPYPFGESSWLNYKSITQREVGSAGGTLNNDYIIDWTLAPVPAEIGSNNVISLPPANAAMTGRMIIVKVSASTSASLLRVRVDSDSSTINGLAQVTIAQYHSRSFFCDGTDWTCLGDISNATLT